MAPLELLHSSLSWEAIGVLLYLLTKPPYWVVRIQDIVNHSPDGWTKVQRCIRELTAAGYMLRVRDGKELKTVVANRPVFSGKPALNLMPATAILKLPVTPFVMVDVSILENPELSWKAKGILCYMLSFSSRASFSPGFLCKRGCGLASVYSGLRELLEHGYLKTKDKRSINGEFDGIEYIVYESPQAQASDSLTPYKRKPERDFREGSKILNISNRSNDCSSGAWAAELVTLFQIEFKRGLSPMERSAIRELAEKFSARLIAEALRRAVLRGKLFLSYVIGILRNWSAAGVQTVADIALYEQRFQRYAEKNTARLINKRSGFAAIAKCCW